jgi:hypothetical protein
VREALRAGRQPKESLRRDGLTRRAALPDMVLMTPSGEELLLMNHGRYAGRPGVGSAKSRTGAEPQPARSKS